MKFLNGADLASYIKVRQAQQVRALRQACKIKPRLAIVVTKNDPVIDSYVRLKKSYGEDILIDVQVYKVAQSSVNELIGKLNQDQAIHGIIIQLPLENPDETDAIVSLIDEKKDVDNLGATNIFDSATPLAINWLLASHNIELKNKKIVIIGNGRLVGMPLAKMWLQSGYNVKVIDKGEDIATEVTTADILVTATGQPNLITSDMIAVGSVVVDAGVASEAGKIVGDLDEKVYKRTDLTITPRKGGVGPLTVVALFENVIRASRSVAELL